MVGGNADAFVAYLMNTNPEFNRIARENLPKGPNQAFKEIGIDFSQISNLL